MTTIPTEFQSNKELHLESILKTICKITFKEYIPTNLPVVPPLETPTKFEHEHFVESNNLHSTSMISQLNLLIDQKEDSILDLKLKLPIEKKPFDFEKTLDQLQDHHHHQSTQQIIFPSPKISFSSSFTTTPITPTSSNSCDSDSFSTTSSSLPLKPFHINIKTRITKTEQFVKFFNFLLQDFQEERHLFHKVNSNAFFLKEKVACKFEYLFSEALSSSDFQIDFGALKEFLQKFLLPFIIVEGSQEFLANEWFLEAFSSLGFIIRIALTLFQSSIFPSSLKNEEFLGLIEQASLFFFRNLSFSIGNAENAIATAFYWIESLQKYALSSCQSSEAFRLMLFKVSLSCLEFFQEPPKSSHLMKLAVKAICTVLSQVDSPEFYAEEIISNQILTDKSYCMSVDSQKHSLSLFNYLLIYAVSSLNSMEKCESFACKIWTFIFTRLSDKSQFPSIKNLIEAFLLQSIPLIPDIFHFPGGEFLLRNFVPFAIKASNDSSIDFVARGKCIDWLGLILENIFSLSSALSSCPQLERQAIVSSFLFHCQNHPSFAFNVLDFALEQPFSDSCDHYEKAFLFKVLFSMQEPIFSVIFHFTNDQANHYRSKALKIISTLLRENPSLSSKGFVLNSIQKGISHASPTVREASLDLLGNLILQDNPLSVNHHQTIFSICLLKINDPSPIIRKKILKLIQEYHSHLLDDLSLFGQTFQAVLHQASIESDSSVLKSVYKTWSLLFSHFDQSLNALSLILGPLNSFESSLSPNIPTLWMELLKAHPSETTESISKIIRLALEDLIHKEKFNFLGVLAFFCQFQPQLLHGDFKQILYFIELIAQEPDPVDRIVPLCHLLEIVSQILPGIAFCGSSFCSLEGLLLFFIIKYPENVAQIAMKCFVSLCGKRKKHGLLEEIKEKFFLLLSPLNNPNPNKSTQSRALINLCNLTFYTRNEVEVTFDRIISSLDLKSSSPSQFHSFYLHSLGKLIILAPALGLKINFLISHFLESSDPQEIAMCLKIFNETLAFSESESSSSFHSEPQPSSSMMHSKTHKKTESLAADVLNDSGNTGFCNALIQAHFKGISKASLSGKHLELQSLAFNVIEKSFSLGIVHPIEIISISFGLAQSLHPPIAERASNLFKILLQKHRSLVYSKGLESIFNAFQVNPQSYGHLHEIYEIFAGKRPKRNEFFRSLLSIFEVSSVNGKKFGSFDFCLFVSQFISSLDFHSMEDLHLILKSLNGLCSTTLEIPREAPNAKENILRLLLAFELREYLIDAFGVDFDHSQSDTVNSCDFKAPPPPPQKSKKAKAFSPDSSINPNSPMELLWQIYEQFAEAEDEVINSNTSISKRRKQ